MRRWIFGHWIELHLLFEPRDLWIGVYWRGREGHGFAKASLELYICIVPMLPIHLEIF